MAHRPRPAAKTRNGSDDTESHQLAFDYAAGRPAALSRPRPPVWRYLFLAGINPGLWTLVCLGLFLAAMLRLLP
jgi:hypothetical protein